MHLEQYNQCGSNNHYKRSCSKHQCAFIGQVLIRTANNDCPFKPKYCKLKYCFVYKKIWATVIIYVGRHAIKWDIFVVIFEKKLKKNISFCTSIPILKKQKKCKIFNNKSYETKYSIKLCHQLYRRTCFHGQRSQKFNYWTGIPT